MNRRNAIRRNVLDVQRVGDWGEVEWHHILSCGHVEIRRRRAPGALTCTTCIRAADASQALTRTVTVPAGSRPVRPSGAGGLRADDAGEQVELLQVQAAVAAHVGVDPAMVDIRPTAWGPTASVFLDVDAVARLSR